MLPITTLDASALERALALPAVSFEENAEIAEGLRAAGVAHSGPEGGFQLALSTATAFRLEVAAMFCAALARRAGLPPERQVDMELAVHEAIANALLHGNLGLASRTGTSMEAFTQYGEELARRLNDPTLAARCLSLNAYWNGKMVEVSVGDEGNGYSPTPHAMAAPHAQTGRGLALIRSLAASTRVSRKGRRITMVFDP